MIVDNDANTAYLALARKYRPIKFSEVIGQDALVQVLTNSLIKNRIHHAYLFSGVRGVGKTTTARILAAALICEQRSPDQAEPCGKCNACKDILANKHIDVIEFDAASHTSVENIRDLIESVPYRPAMAKYKIYIIDEIHMLSEKAFNALLKTLEEPPQRVVFIFATTEIRQIPTTILSRCIQFDLKLVSRTELSKRLVDIAKAEGFSIEEDALDTLVTGAQGSVRDSQSLLDQSLTIANNGIVTGSAVRSMLGISSKKHLFSLLNNLLQGNITEALKITNTMITGGSDTALLTKDLMEIIHSVTESVINNDLNTNSNKSENDKKSIDLLSSKLSVDKSLKIWQILQKGYQEILWSPLPNQSLSMMMIKIAFASKLPSIEPYLESLLSKKPLILHTSTNQEVKNTPVHTLPSKRAPENVPENSEKPRVNESNKPNIDSYANLAKLAKDKQRIILTRTLESHMSLHKYKIGELSVFIKPNAPKNIIKNTMEELKVLTGISWIINRMIPEDNNDNEENPMQKTISENRKAENNTLLSEFKNQDYVKNIESKSNFKLVSVNKTTSGENKL